MPGATPLRESACRVSKTEGFLRFFNFWNNPLRESGCRVSKTGGFASFGVPGAPLSGKTRVECQKLRVFCVFGVPESVLRIVLTIRFASYGRFFERAKMSENRQKTLKTWGFWQFFRVRSNPLRESGCRVLKTEGFLRFWCARICANNSFCLIRPSPNPVPR